LAEPAGTGNRYCAATSSISKTNVAFGGITPFRDMP
jgi:hypothetical protein